MAVTRQKPISLEFFDILGYYDFIIPMWRKVSACRQAGRGSYYMAKYFVYAIKSLKDGRIYVGMTCNLERRIIEHNQGRTPSTKPYCPWKLLYCKNSAK